MKNINKKNKNIDAMDEAREKKKFQEYTKDANLRIRLAVEVYNARRSLDISQQKLAKEISSTQKVVSKIENADVNIGIDLLFRISEKLNFNSSILGRIFAQDIQVLFFPLRESADSSLSETKKKNSILNNSVII